jgi:hypothetical protein
MVLRIPVEQDDGLSAADVDLPEPESIDPEFADRPDSVDDGAAL